MFKYLHNGTYHTDVSSNYMDDLGLDDDAQQGVLSQKAYEESQEPPHVASFKAKRQASIDAATVVIAQASR